MMKPIKSGLTKDIPLEHELVVDVYRYLKKKQMPFTGIKMHWAHLVTWHR